MEYSKLRGCQKIFTSRVFENTNVIHFVQIIDVRSIIKFLVQFRILQNLNRHMNLVLLIRKEMAFYIISKIYQNIAWQI